MAERERSKDRAPSHASQSGGSGGSGGAGGGGYFMGLFGGSIRRAAPPSMTRAHVTQDARRKSHKKRSMEEITSPRLGSPSTAQTLENTRRPPTPLQFDLQAAITAMQADQDDEASNSNLVETVNSIASYLAKLLISSEDVFSAPLPESKAVVSVEDVRTLYIRAAAYANAKADSALRTSAIRLLAALIATYPPTVFPHHAPHVALPDIINVRSLYSLIVSPTAASTPAAHVDAVFVEVGALKALTKNGEAVDGLDGIVGWLVRTLVEMTDELAAWCTRKDDTGYEWVGDVDKHKPFGPIRPASPGDAAIAIIDLISAIVLSHTPLFSPADLDRVVQPMLNAITAGIASSTASPPEEYSAFIASTSRRGSPAASALNSPTVGVLGLEPSLRQSIVTRTRKDTISSQGTPTPKMVARPSSATTTALTSPQSATSTAFHSSSPQFAQVEAKWTRPIPTLCAFLDGLINEATISDDLFFAILLFLCVCFGQDETEFVPETTWNALYEVLHLMLGPKGGRRAEQILLTILEGRSAVQSKIDKMKVPEGDRKVARGAVIACRSLFQHLSNAGDLSGSTGTFSCLVPSLRAAQSSSRFLDAKSAERSRWQPVDYEILALLQDHLFDIENTNGSENTLMGDAWTEGTAASELLSGMVPVVMNARLSFSQRRSEDMVQPIEGIFDAVVHQLPGAIARLHSSSSSSPTFLHPKYIQLLVDLAPTLDEEDAILVIDYYQRECLCLPFTSNWIRNIWKLLQAFYLSPTSLPTLRRKVTTLLFRDIYGYAEDLPEHRRELVEKAIVPFLEKVLIDEQDGEFVQEGLGVLVSAAVAETMERDEERRKARALKRKEENEKEDALALPSQDVQAAASGGSFDAIRTLIIKLAAQTACRGETKPPVVSPPPTIPAPAMSSRTTSSNGLERSGSEKRSARNRDSQPSSTLRGLIDVLSPPNKTKELPPMSALASPTSEMDASSILPTPPGTASHETPVPPTTINHAQCKSLHAVKSLIAIFTRLAFAPTHTFTSETSSGRTPASSRSIAIYRDLLGLLFPMTDDQQGRTSTNTIVKIPAHCPKARIAILQFLTRLRADSKHRIYLRCHIDKAVKPFAVILRRTKETEAEKRAETEEAQRRQAARMSGRTENNEERGRAAKSSESTTRSRSRSKQPPLFRTSAPEAVNSYDPLWRIPDELAFDVPDDNLPSEGMTTYDPNHPSLKDPNSPPVEGVWLPVSEYVRVLNGILRSIDWELVSYVLTFLPIQLSNKLFFHGSRAIAEVRALLDVLCSGVLGSGTPWEKRFTSPSFIKRADINAAAYQSLSILISYRGMFSRAECDRLVQAFMAGLQGKGELAKPCLQALTLAVYELEQSVGRNLFDIVRAMTSILTTTGLAVHILEFLIALGQNRTLFRNFTDEQYRLVFRVAIGYITEHNARSDQAVDLRDPATREGFILSQHVIGLAYYSIYIWFLALRLPQRPNLVTEITREILKGRSQRVVIDEMAEVCFDWLARYTYGNADPKPANSFLSEIVTAEDKDSSSLKSQSWLLGGGIITVTNHARSGWATITTTRPTGTTAVVCKLENVPLVDLGEADADMISLPAVLMANRDPSFSQGADLPDPRKIVDAKSTVPPAENFDHNSQHGFIWSGATPSQRRKDVVVEPSYLALQLLSSYPNASLDTPRGHLIPNEDKFARALRGIQNTPVIDTLKIAVLYVSKDQVNETDILGNIDGSPLYLDFLSGLGRLIRLKGQVDVFVGGLNRDNDSDGEYAYAWWDDLTQVIFHTPTMMPNQPSYPNFENKKRLVGNDYIKIVYNDSGKEFAFDTIKTAWNFINIVISPHTTGVGEDELPRGAISTGWRAPGRGSWGGEGMEKTDEGWLDWDREDWFKVTLQRADGIPDFTPIGTHKLVSRTALPILVRQIAHLANNMAARFQHIRNASDAASAEYITSWRSRLRAMHRLRTSLPPVEVPDPNDQQAREYLVRDFTRTFSYRPTTNDKQ